jgi:hypothetical protein
MLIPGKQINIFDMDESRVQGSWFTGKMNTQKLDFDPLVTGYAFIIWTKLPFWVQKTYTNFADMTQKNFKSFDGLANMELQTAQYTHTFNANSYEYATSIQKQNTNFTIKHQEFSGNPIKNMYQFWITGIRDPETDIAVYPRAFGCTYGAKNHTGELLYIVTRPDANNVERNNIEFAAYYTAVMPTTLPIQHFAYNQGDHNSPEIDINFVGDLHLGPEVDNYAAEVLQDQHVTIARPYPILTTADFDPSNRDYKDSMATPDTTLNSLPTGGWNKLNDGLQIEIGDEKMRAPAWDATSGTNSNNNGL